MARLTARSAATVSRAMGGSCSMPLAAHGQWHGDTLHLDAAWGDPEGRIPLVRAHAAGTVLTLEQANALGQAVATQLRAGGAIGVAGAADSASAG